MRRQACNRVEPDNAFLLNEGTLVHNASGLILESLRIDRKDILCTVCKPELIDTELVSNRRKRYTLLVFLNKNADAEII